MNHDHAGAPGDPFAHRLRIYLGERFPVAAHGVLITSFAGAAVCVSALARGGTPNLSGLAIAFVVLFLLFFQLRVADEHKDFADDSRYRPHRAVPRGLITLGELRALGFAAAALQLAVSLALHPWLLVVLIVVWAWMALMTAEFFVADWLKRHPLVYLFSHMVAMPAFALYATACDWVVQTGHSEQPVPLALFLALAFFSGIAIEIGRKCRAPADERDGVDTYSSLWGARRAGHAVALAVTLVAGLAIALLHRLDTGLFLAGGIVVLWLAALVVVLRYAGNPVTATATRVETAAALFVLAVYLVVGPLALGYRLWMS